MVGLGPMALWALIGLVAGAAMLIKVEGRT
jgi:hypothetical protein